MHLRDRANLKDTMHTHTHAHPLTRTHARTHAHTHARTHCTFIVLCKMHWSKSIALILPCVPLSRYPVGGIPRDFSRDDRYNHHSVQQGGQELPSTPRPRLPRRLHEQLPEWRPRHARDGRRGAGGGTGGHHGFTGYVDDVIVAETGCRHQQEVNCDQ